MLRASAATIDVTPTTPCPLAGFAERIGPFVQVSSSLEANAVCFRDQDGRCAVLLTIDALYVGKALQLSLAEHFVSAHRQNADDLLVLASHTHFAPSIDSAKPVLGSVDPAYLNLVIARCRTLLDQVMASESGAIRFERRIGESSAAINRRRRWPFPHLYRRRLVRPQVVMAPNPNGPLDRSITAITMVDSSGIPTALFWHYACHPTAFPQPLNVSADFPGVVRARLRQRYGATLPVLFLQGFAGDLRPRIPEHRPLARRAFYCALLGPSFSAFTIEGWRAWSEALADDVLAAFSNENSVSVSVTDELTISSASNSIFLDRLLTEEQGDRAVSFQRLRLSSNFDMVAVAAEPLTGLRASMSIEGALGVGYLGDVFGYWPTDKDAADGGYEANHHLRPFGLRGKFRRSLDDPFRRSVDALRQLK